jgi:hypothetical protein
LIGLDLRIYVFWQVELGVNSFIVACYCLV